MTMSYNQHLVETFYISKPEIQQVVIDDKQQSKSEDQIHEDRPLKRCKTVKFGSVPEIKYKKDPQCQRILKMIKQQLNPSTEVHSKPKLKKKINEKETNKKFLSQFETFFRGFIKSSQLDEEYLRRKSRKNTKKKTTRKFLPFESQINQYITVSQNQDSIEDEEDSDFFVKEEPPKLNYHERMRHKIESKIGSLVQNQGEKKLHKVQMKDKRTSAEVTSIINLKNKCKKVPPKLRIIRSGLPINIAELDPKAKNNRQGMVEDNKAKKDHGFYKVLQKSCQVVLSEISNYEKGEEASKKITRHITPSRSRSAAKSYLKETASNTAKKEERLRRMRRSMDDEDQHQWKSKCKQIQVKSINNLKKSRKLGGGLKVFEKYCNFVDRKWQKDQHRIKTLLAQETHPRQEPLIYTNF